MSRFRGAMDHYSTLFEIYDATLPHPERVIMEQEVQGRAILNIVACEGLERVERAEPYTSWHARSLRAGFTQIPIPESTKSKIRTLMTHFPRDFSIGEDNGWFLAGWKGKVCYALSACQPTSRMTSSKQPPWMPSSCYIYSSGTCYVHKLVELSALANGELHMPICILRCEVEKILTLSSTDQRWEPLLLW